MDLKNIRSELHKLTAVVEGWENLEQIPALDRDLALEKLRVLYEVLRFGVAEQTPLPTSSEAPEEQAVALDIDLGEVLSLDPVAEAPMPEPEPEPEMPEPEPVVMPEVEPAFEPEPAPFAEPTSAPAEEPAPKPAEAPQAPTLFGEEDETLRHRHKQRVIMSLYDTAPAASRPAAAPAPKPASEPAASPVSAPESEMPEPVAQQPIPQPETIEVIVTVDDPEAEIEEITVVTTGSVLGDVINHDVQTLADTLSAPRNVASGLRSEPIGDLHRAIGINDKFLLIRDLFGGDGEAFEKAIRALNEAESLDDCMIYIAENYAWNPNSDGAKLVMELLERKFS